MVQLPRAPVRWRLKVLIERVGQLGVLTCREVAADRLGSWMGTQPGGEVAGDERQRCAPHAGREIAVRAGV